MTPEDQNLLGYYWKQFEDEIKNQSAFYDITVRMILTIPFFVNAGAAISLASFYSNPKPHLAITLATIAFICGTIFGLLTLIFEFFAAYFSQLNFHEYLSFFKDRASGSEEMLKELKNHYGSYFIKIKKTHSIVLFNIINGSISIFLCFLGIYFIVAYLLKNYCVPSIILTLLIVYSFAALIWIKSKFKSDNQQINNVSL